MTDDKRPRGRSAHHAEIPSGIGYSAADVASLRAKKII
jgi:hypothetical protein